MTEQTAARRLRFLESLRQEGGGRELASYAEEYGVDERTLRRDVEYLQDLLTDIQNIEVRRGKVYPSRGGHAAGYFADQLNRHEIEKRAIAQAIVSTLADNLAIIITAGTTTYYVAKEIRRTRIEEDRPRNLIAFTNSLPALLELVMAGVSTGVIGEVYSADDRAFHAPEYHSAFQPNIAIVGASGAVIDPIGGSLDLFCHRAEEAAFLKQLLRHVPEIIVALDSSKIGHRHPWSFTSGGILANKTVRLYTSPLSEAQRDICQQLVTSASKTNCRFSFSEHFLQES
jgi:DeoR/GlpR family transcriptional regulator of sugar metabolism